MRELENSTIRLPEDRDSILNTLESGTMAEAHGMLRWSSNSTFLVSIIDKNLTMPAVYKPQRGERPLWDFPDGTLCHRERAAYLVSDALGWHLVPPTILRDGLRGYGSVQYYVTHDPDVNYFTLDEQHHDQLRRMTVFDYIINNADRKGGHCLLDKLGHLWGIDHGIGFHVAPKLRTVIWDFAGESVPRDLLNDIERVYCEFQEDQHQLRKEMDRLLAHAEVSAFIARMRKILQRREFPRPGPGPNYPWPPV